MTAIYMSDCCLVPEF